MSENPRYLTRLSILFEVGEDCSIMFRDLYLPFVPYPGLTLYFGDLSERPYTPKVERVSWTIHDDNGSGSFIATLEPPGLGTHRRGRVISGKWPSNATLRQMESDLNAYGFLTADQVEKRRKDQEAHQRDVVRKLEERFDSRKKPGPKPAKRDSNT